MVPPSCRRRLIPAGLATALIALTLALSAPGASAAPPAVPGHGVAVAVTVTIYSYGFVPQNVTIAAGETVRWVNADSTKHTVTADNNTFNGQVPPRAAWSHAFPQRGTHSYYCTIHPEMRGTITVS